MGHGISDTVLAAVRARPRRIFQRVFRSVVWMVPHRGERLPIASVSWRHVWRDQPAGQRRRHRDAVLSLLCRWQQAAPLDLVHVPTEPGRRGRRHYRYGLQWQRHGPDRGILFASTGDIFDRGRPRRKRYERVFGNERIFGNERHVGLHWLFWS